MNNCFVPKFVNATDCECKMSRSNDLCFSCHEEIDSQCMNLSCIDCGFSYHLGNCSGVSESTFRTNNKRGTFDTWKCQTCRVSKSRHKPSDTATPSDINHQLSEIKQMLSSLLPISAKVDDLSKTTEEMRLSVEVMPTKYDEMLKKQTGQEKSLKDLSVKVRRLEDSGRCETDQLRQELNRLEQYTRLNNIELHGIKVTQNEDLHEKLCQVADQLKLSRPTTDQVEAIHRLPSRPGKVPSVIVKFVNRKQRNEWLSNKRRLRENTNSEEQIFVDENMTKHNRHIFFLARAKLKEGNIKYAWHKDGVTYVRKTENGPAIRILHESDLDKV